MDGVQEEVDTKKGPGSQRFKPGAYTAFIAPKTAHIPGAYNDVVVHTAPLVRFGDEVGSKAHGIARVKNPGIRMPYDTMRDGGRRCLLFLFGKKFMASLDPQTRVVFAEYAKVIARMEINAPTVFLKLVEQFGMFKDKAGGYYRLRGAIIAGFDCFLKGVFVPGRDGVGDDVDEEDLYVNLQYRNIVTELIAYYTIRWAAYARDTDAVIQIGGATMRVPEYQQNFQAAVQQLNAANMEIPPERVRDLQRLAILETLVIPDVIPRTGVLLGQVDIPNTRGLHWPTPQQLAGLNQLGVRFVNWTTDIIRDRYVSYVRTVQDQVIPVLATAFNITESIGPMKESGTAAITVVADVGYQVKHLTLVNQDELAMGYMFQGSVMILYQNFMYKTEAEEEPRVAINDFLENFNLGLDKKGKN